MVKKLVSVEELTLLLNGLRTCAEQSMGAGNRVGIGSSYRPDRLHRLAESTPWPLKSFKILSQYSEHIRGSGRAVRCKMFASVHLWRFSILTVLILQHDRALKDSCVANPVLLSNNLARQRYRNPYTSVLCLDDQTVKNFFLFHMQAADLQKRSLPYSKTCKYFFLL